MTRKTKTAAGSGDGGIYDRYWKHLLLREIGVEGQAILSKSAVLVVGCGALGCMLASLMTRAGVGRIRIVDDDIPKLRDLHRQLLFDEKDVKAKRPKVEAATARLELANSSVKVEGIRAKATKRNIRKLLRGMDLVLDASDSLETRYLVNEACHQDRKPWIYAGLLGTTGLVMPIRFGEGPCLRCLYPDPGLIENAPGCDERGVLSTAVVAVASIQATEGMKILFDSPEAARDMICLDIWNATIRHVVVKRRETCPVCGVKSAS